MNVFALTAAFVYYTSGFFLFFFSTAVFIHTVNLSCWGLKALHSSLGMDHFNAKTVLGNDRYRS